MANPPKTGTFSCSTEDCRGYLEKVRKKGIALDKAYADRLTAAKDGSRPLSPQQTVDLTADYNTFLAEKAGFEGENNKAFLKSYEDCDSTFPGPCKDAIERAYQYEVAIETHAKVLEAYPNTKKTNIDIVKPGNKGPSGSGGNNGGGSLVSVNVGAGFGIVVGILVLGAGYMILKK